MPNSRQSSELIAFTVSNKFASSPGCPAAAIQFAESLILPNSPMLAAAIFVIASPTAILPEAGALNAARGVLSPIAIASPVSLSKPLAVIAISLTGTCHGPTS